MAVIKVGDKQVSVTTKSPVLSKAVFYVSPKYLKMVRREASRSILGDLSGLIQRADRILVKKQREKTGAYQPEDIRADVAQQRPHDNKSQTSYLKETRKYWGERYSLREVVWMDDFRDFAIQMDGFGDAWFSLYQLIRGDLPDNFPTTICFSSMIENICNRRVEAYVRGSVEKYFREHPRAKKQILKGNTPIDLPVNEEFGLVEESYQDYVAELVAKGKSLKDVRV